MKKFIIICILIFAIYKIPDITSNYNKIYRLNLFEEMQNSIISDKFSAKDYWEFRERFSPGSFTTNSDFVEFYMTFRITKLDLSLTPLLLYKSNYLNSSDNLIPNNGQYQISQHKNEIKGEIIKETDDILFLKTHENKYLLVFIQPIAKMKEVNGMFDYKKDESELIKDQLWLNITEISLN